MPTNAEINLNRLKRTNLADEFVRAHHGAWDHQAWLEFCAHIEDKGYTPVDLDQVGLLLESKKAEFWRNEQENGGK